MAVRHDQRGSGIGAALLDALIGVARSRGDPEVLLHAQTPRRLLPAGGFRPRGEPFEEAGIVHVEMGARLTPHQVAPVRRAVRDRPALIEHLDVARPRHQRAQAPASVISAWSVASMPPARA